MRSRDSKPCWSPLVEIVGMALLVCQAFPEPGAAQDDSARGSSSGSSFAERASAESTSTESTSTESTPTESTFAKSTSEASTPEAGTSAGTNLVVGGAGMEFQAYPAGVIVTANYRVLIGARTLLGVHLGGTSPIGWTSASMSRRTARDLVSVSPSGATFLRPATAGLSADEQISGHSRSTGRTLDVESWNAATRTFLSSSRRPRSATCGATVGT